jgi:hypothetical protein
MRRSCQMCALLLLVVGSGSASPAIAADAQRQQDVRQAGAEVMPFSLERTVHVFEKNDAGGLQRVLVRGAADEAQQQMIRMHLHQIAESFVARDFDKPSHIHGDDMPGLAQLKAAKAGELEVIYSELPQGAQIIYRSASPQIITAIHRWFDAQLADHGNDATSGTPAAAHHQ